MAGTNTKEVVVHMFSTVLGAAQGGRGRWSHGRRRQSGAAAEDAVVLPQAARSVQWLLTTVTLRLLRPLTQLYPRQEPSTCRSG